MSPPPFDSLNLGNPGGSAVQDDRANIRENYARLFDAAGLAGRAHTWVHQIHGVTAARTWRPAEASSSFQADALVSRETGEVISVRVADCVPVLMANADGAVVAAVHAGWRGVVAGVAVAAAMVMRDELSIHPESMVAAIGPGIGPASFEVGPEVVEAVLTSMGDLARSFIHAGGRDRCFVDLPGLIREQLRGFGLADEHVDGTDRCTYRDRDEFYSHRRDAGLSGRMAACIGCCGA